MFVLSYFVGTLNSSVNSVVYGICSRKYREVFFEHFCCKKPIQAVSLTIVTTNYWSEELSWIEFRQEHLKDFLLKLMKYKLHITYINIVFFIKGNLYRDQIQKHSITLSFSKGKQSFFYYRHSDLWSTLYLQIGPTFCRKYLKTN